MKDCVISAVPVCFVCLLVQSGSYQNSPTHTHFPTVAKSDIPSDDWVMLVCYVPPLWDNGAHCVCVFPVLVQSVTVILSQNLTGHKRRCVSLFTGFQWVRHLRTSDGIHGCVRV